MAIIIFTSVAQVILALFVYLKGRKNLTNAIFALLTISALAWALVNYLTSISLGSPHLIYYVRFILFFVVFLNAFFYLFGLTFPNSYWPYSRRRFILWSLFTLLTAGLTVSPYVFPSVIVTDGIATTTAGPGIAVFIAHSALAITVAFRALARKYRRSAGASRRQLQLLLIASFFIWIVSPITNFILAPLLKTTIFTSIGPIYTLVFSSIIAYAIIAQKLFDIRAAVARSVGYTFTLVTLAAFYIIVAFTLPSRFLNVPAVSMRVQIVYASLALLLAFSFSSVKRVFDQLSNRYFYQDAYDPQELLNNINRALATTTYLEQLLTKTLSHMVESLKCEYSAVVLISAGAPKPRIFMAGNKVPLSDKDAEDYLDYVGSNAARIITVADDVPYNRTGLHSLLNKNDVAVIARLGKHHHAENVQTGYILLGSKRSGNSYTEQDVRVVEIIANELVVAIQNALRFEEIESFNATLQQKVATATKRMSESNRKLKILNETKDDFIGMASHQLRTPLTSVKGYLSLVLDGDAGKLNDMQSQLLTQAFVSSQRMVSLIADLLNVSRLRTGKFVIERSPTNIANMIGEEIGQLREVAAARGLKLAYDAPASFPSLPLDVTKTRQVIMNFMDNAIYYTPSGGHIKVELQDLPKSVEFRVIDEGIGVPKHEHHHLFTKFYRADNAQRARPDGTGLGLYMAKKVIIAEGGSIIFSSVEGEGSTFGFSFPKNLPTETVLEDA